MTDASLHAPPDEPDAKRRRVTPDGFVTDAELMRLLNLPDKVGRMALAALDSGAGGMRGFPRKLKLFGGRRYMPAVREWFLRYHGVSAADNGVRLTGGSTWIDQKSRTG